MAAQTEAFGALYFYLTESLCTRPPFVNLLKVTLAVFMFILCIFMCVCVYNVGEEEPSTCASVIHAAMRMKSSLVPAQVSGLH